MVIPQARAQAWRGEEQGQKSHFEQHAVGLVACKILGRADEGEKTDKTNQEHGARP
jgi:hypothetical protein